MPGSYEIVQHGLLDDVPVLNRLHMLTDEDDNSADTAFNIAGFWITSIFADYLDCLPEGYAAGPTVVRGIVAVNGGSYTTAKAVQSLFVGTAGNRTGEILSNSTGPIITAPLNSEGLEVRQRVGKIFLPGIVEADAADNAISAAGLLTALGVLAADLALTATLGITVAGVFRTLAQIDPGQYLLDQVEWRVEAWLAVQRRRRPKRGP